MASPKEKIQSRLEMLPWLRGRGPVSYDYGQWVDATHHLLITLFGEESSQAKGFLEVVGEGAEARGWGLLPPPRRPHQLHPHLERQPRRLQRHVVQRGVVDIDLPELAVERGAGAVSVLDPARRPLSRYPLPSGESLDPHAPPSKGQ